MTNPPKIKKPRNSNFSFKLKLFIGIFLPLLFMLVLSMLSMSEIGYNIEKENIRSVDFNQIFINSSTGYYNNKVLIQTVVLKNDFFLPRKFDLPVMAACLIDRGSSRTESLSVQYSEGEYSYKEALIDEIFFPFDSYTKKSLDVSANSEKKVKIYAISKSYSSSRSNEYEQYDEILLVELERGGSSSSYIYSYPSVCSSLTEEEMDNAVHIEIVNKPNPGGVEIVDMDNVLGM